MLTLFSDLTIALGLTRHLLVIQLVWLGVLTPTMVLCVDRWGIVGAGIAHALVVVFVVIPMYIVTLHRGKQVSLAWVPAALARPLMASIVCGVAAYGCTLLLSNQLLQLVVGVIVGLLAYALAAGSWLRSSVKQLRAMYWTRGEPAISDPAAEVTMIMRPISWSEP